MKRRSYGGWIAALAAALSSGLVGCGPSRVQVDPKDVVNALVRPASGQDLFCPGDPFQVELVAKLKDGSSCSSTDRSRGCMGKKDAVLDPAVVFIEASSGAPTGPREQFVWTPDPNPLATAGTGMTLRGWLEQVIDGTPSKSMVGETNLKPVYECRKDNVFTVAQRGTTGENGVKGPDLTIAVTKLSTPFYPDAALIRVEQGAERVYLISPSADRPVRIVSKGQSGGQGLRGVDGRNGGDGLDAGTNEACAKGGDGGDGTDGGPGGPGGDGGPGGSIRIQLDDNKPEKLRGRILVASVGGDAGPGGLGGNGGFGGRGGMGGMTGPDCTATSGQNGESGQDGSQGRHGKPGPDGPLPTIETAARRILFGAEITAIQQIEATKAKR